MKGNFNKELKEYLEKLNVTNNVRTRIILALKRNDCYDFDELKERIKLKDLKGLGKYSLRILSNFVCNVEFSERKFMETEIDDSKELEEMVEIKLNKEEKYDLFKDVVNVFGNDIISEVNRIYNMNDIIEDDLVKLVDVLKILRSIK